MTGTTLRSKRTTVDLANYATGNPFTVGAQTSIITSTSPIGIYGDASEAWTLTNSGTVSCSEYGDRGGVVMNADGKVTNKAGGLISGVSGVNIFGYKDVVSNAGTISGFRDGGIFLGGGSVDNVRTRSTISGLLYGVEVGHGGGHVVNAGAIKAQTGRSSPFGVISTYGVITLGAASVTNQGAGALIRGDTGIFVLEGLGTVVNNGRIVGTRSGVRLKEGGSVTNQAGGVISGQILITNAAGVVTNAGEIVATRPGQVGVTLGSGFDDTLTNSGTITGYGGGAAVGFGAGDDHLTVDPGAVFVGAVHGGGGANILELAEGAAAGAFTGLGSQFTRFESVTVDAGAAWTLTGTNRLYAGDTLTSAGSLTAAGTIAGAGNLALAGGAVAFDAGAKLSVAKVTVSGTSTVVGVNTSLAYAGEWTQTAGTLTVASGNTLSFKGAASSLAGTLAGAGTVAFSAGAETLAGATLTVGRVNLTGGTMTLSGKIADDTALAVTGTGAVTIAAAGVSLTGSGSISLAGNTIEGATAAALLTNDSRLEGAGHIGGGQMKLVNAGGGVIEAEGAGLLTLDTGANVIANFGVIESAGAGGLTIASAIDNDGRLSAALGVLKAAGAVSGTGKVLIGDGTADFASSFNQDVVFRAGSTGTLELSKSQGFKRAIFGFSATGATTLDLGDIGFVSSGEASFVENAAGTWGVLTVTDGTHTASITLEGDYAGSTFVASSDGHGGTKIIDPAITAGGSATATPSDAPAGGFSFNVATGQNALGVIQTAGALPDANWTVTNADTYEDAPIAYTVAPGDIDRSTGWSANGPDSSWICANPYSSRNGNMTFTLKFDLAGYNPADATLSGGELAADDFGAVSLNGHVLGQTGSYTLQALSSNGAGDFVYGWNTLVIQISKSDNYLEAVRLQGTVVDTVASGPPVPIHWASAVNGNFATAADWTGGAAPLGNNDAILDASGAAFTVTASTGQTVNSLQTAANATLDITGGSFSALAGTGGGANAGAIVVGDLSALSVSGGVDNSGSISLEGAATLSVGTTTLTGGGELTLGDAWSRHIIAVASGAVLTNADNTITGGGWIGVGDDALTLINQAKGVIEATAPAQSPLRIDTGSAMITNAGLLAAAGTGRLHLFTSPVTNTGLIEAMSAGSRVVVTGDSVEQSGGGTIAALDGGTVYLQGAEVIGGALSTSGSGRIFAAKSGNLFDGTAGHAVSLDGRFRLANGGTLTLEGSMVNTATVYIGRVGAVTELMIGAGGAALSGGGRWVLGNGPGNLVGAAAAATLTNVDDVITGGAALGDADLTLVNDTGGTIEGNNTSALTIDTGANRITNAGLIENTGTGGTLIKSAIANAGELLAAKGTLTVQGAVTGTGEVEIKGGTADFAAAFSQRVTFLPGSTGTLELANSQAYKGAITGFSKTGATALDLDDIGFVSADQATFVENKAATGGVLTVTDGTHTASITLKGDYAGSTFVASSDGHGGTKVVDPAGEPPAATATAIRVHPFVDAIAGFGADHAAASPIAEAWRPQTPALARPSAQFA